MVQELLIMALLVLIGAPLLVSSSNSGAEIAATSNVIWTDPLWADDGTGQMPLGNGDVTASVWVSETTGDLRVLLGKSDVFDENSQPVKVGVLRVSFDPPLWSSSAPTPAPIPDPGALTRFHANPGLIGTQSAQFKSPPGFQCSSIDACPQESAVLCDSIPNCMGFSLNKEVSPWNLAPELFTVPQPDTKKPGPGWTHWQRVQPAPPTPHNDRYEQTLDVANATVIIKTTNLTVQIYVNATSPSIRISALPAPHIPAFSIKATLEPYRKHQRTTLGRQFCYPRYEQPDTVVMNPPSSGTLENAVVWYHWNGQYGNATYFNDTMVGQNMPLDHPDLPDMFFHRAFGGAIFGSGLTRNASDATVVSGTGLTTLDLSVVLHVEQVDDISQWMTGLSDRAESSATLPVADEIQAHRREWASVWNRSYVAITSTSDSANAKAVTDHCNWDRFLSMAQGRSSFAPIKFNGQAYNCNNTGKGWDARDWGAGYWWQNTRQPYYNSLAEGDIDMIHSMFDFYLRMLPYVEERTKRQFENTSTPLSAGALYEETCTQFGLYNQGDWGCGSPTRKYGASSNTYIRFHFTGSLELSLMILDDWIWNGDLNALKRYLPIPVAVVEGYRQRFPNRDAAGKIDMWPAQALETWQCPDPTSRLSCPTNPSTDISGMQAVLSRLIKLPANIVTPDQIEGWAALLKDLPPIPTGGGKILPASKYFGRPHNSENTELYPVHPFRVYMNGKPDLEIAQETYRQRPHPCNDGWCQDVIDAAMLNLTDEAKTQVTQRANAGPAAGFRFRGFAAHYQDYEPSLDHFAFMRTAVNYMLLNPIEDSAQRILVFPTFPTNSWDVEFKLHGPLSTTIEASCKGGELEYLRVDPPNRLAEVTILNCKQ